MKTRSHLSRTTFWLVVACTALLAGCKYTAYQIVLPYANAKYIDQLPDRFLIRYQSQPKVITLNGIPVQQYFTFQDGEATASGDTLSGYLRQGQNNIAVDPDQFGPRRFFYYDTEGPRVVVDHVQTDGNVTIQGELKDPSGPYSATLNGIPLTLDKTNHFSITVDPAPVYTFKTEDQYAQTATRQFADRASIISDAVKLQVDQNAINALVPAVEQLVQGQNIAALLGDANANTLFDKHIGVHTPGVTIIPEICVPVIGCHGGYKVGSKDFDLLDVSASLTNLEANKIDVNQLQINSGSGWEGVNLDGTLNGVHLGVHIHINVLGLSGTIHDVLKFLGLNDKLSALAGDFTVNVAVNQLRANADLGLSATNGKANINVVAIHAVGLDGANSDFNFQINLPSAISNFGLGLGGKVADAISSGINGARDVIVNLLLEKAVPAVANLVLDPLINELQVRLGATVNNGALLTALIGIQDFHVVNNKLEIALDGRVGTETTDSNVGDINLGVNLGFPKFLNIDNNFLPGLLGIPQDLGPAPGIVPAPLGFQYTSTAVPAPGNDGDLDIVANTNLINQAILAIYEAGILSPTVNILDQLNTKGLYVITDKDSANTRIVFDPKVSPALSFRGDIQSVAYLNLDHFHVLYQRLNSSGTWENSLDLELSGEIPLQLSVDGDKGLQLALINPAVELNFDYAHWFDYRLMLPTRLFVARGIAALLIEQLNKGLAQVKLPQDLILKQAASSLVINPETIKTVGTPRDHIAISANLHDQ